jgi:SAM-dependent methyltransferase
MDKLNAKYILDIGAAYNGFSRTLAAFDSSVKITMVDLGFPQGLKKTSPQISTLGSDAAKMDRIADETIDLVCMHNAFEHFSGGSDIGCVRELSRVLKPGGVALITPFFFAQKHSITLSPAPSFLFDRSNNYAEIVRKELDQTNGRLDFNTRIVSPFARRYDVETAVSRIVEPVPKLHVSLRKCVFSEFQPSTAYNLSGQPDMILDPRLYELSHFNFLEIKKL